MESDIQVMSFKPGRPHWVSLLHSFIDSFSSCSFSLRAFDSQSALLFLDASLILDGS